MIFEALLKSIKTIDLIRIFFNSKNQIIYSLNYKKIKIIFWK